ncbi:RNA-directed DNA polymerase [Streptomyces sp. P01-B04]|uniref:reverse transcriptase family protein n=1 Tax=Streptomyces poriferorum TaxID=2798799 RepID=UPI001C605C9B|nr:reverse transcriptase family protein [Streptomyces poriferorum]MBW5248402.1 RNA-directed DNA polymerase [Streptomyces poriferorum]MBW5256069.1 RNA-directed DNA polymerase [Streptomyces poriferorum]
MAFSVDHLAEQAFLSVKDLEWLSAHLPAGEGTFYVQRRHRKKHGGIREVFELKPPFDTVSKNLHRSFTSRFSYEAPAHVHGFVRGRSTISNASQHLAKRCVLRMDLEDFFPSIGAAAIHDLLREQGYEEKAAELAVNLVTIGGKLPIGLSTSPLLSNLAFLSTDRSLAEYARSEGLSFTRYVDDLTFSGDVTDRHSMDIARILDDAGWSVNTRKTVFMRRGGPQYVTGLYVGESSGPRIPRKVKRKMRWILHVISKFGYAAYMTDFGGEGDEMFRRRLLGWACYIAAVEPDVGYPLLRAFDELVDEEDLEGDEEGLYDLP